MTKFNYRGYPRRCANRRCTGLLENDIGVGFGEQSNPNVILNVILGANGGTASAGS